MTLPLVALALLVGCTSGPPAADPAPTTLEYDLGTAEIVQERFPADSKFRQMPVRLNGLIAVPGEAGPHRVVVILHGTHPGCPTDEMGVDRWPCAADVEQRNYQGFSYLATALADAGYVALVPNINAEYTFGFGEGTPGERLDQLLDLQLRALGEANVGGEDRFGVNLEGQADLSQLALFGHSRGGESALAIANSEKLQQARNGYGPVAGVLQIAAAATSVDPWKGSDVPLATILSSCDGDVLDQDGQFFYEGIRLAGQQTWATSAWLEGATHNGFNSALGADLINLADRPDCAVKLTAEQQQQWLVSYASDFLAVIFSADTAAVARLGLDLGTQAPAELYGRPARVSFLAGKRRDVFVPNAAGELRRNAAGGQVIALDVDTQFCPKGFYTLEMKPGTQPCRRSYVTVPGQPALAVVSWERSGAELQFTLPTDAANVRDYTALTMRAAVDPAAELNPSGSRQAFSVRLTDRAGNSAIAHTSAEEPALGHPAGAMNTDEALGLSFFTGRVPLTSIRFPLAGFAGVDTGDLSEVALVFDQTASGTLFLADVAFSAER
ncbi:MAG: hypothetical protein ACOYEV_06325 [Candidatus Nanopelagicales bacterium]